MKSSPAAAGFDQTRLDAFTAHVGGSGVLIHKGVQVAYWGRANRRLDVGSAGKPMLGHFLYLAIEDGRVPSLDQRLCEWEPGLRNLNPQLGNKDADLTWRHLIEQTSGYGGPERPGESFDYNDYAMGFFAETLISKVWRTEYATSAHDLVAPRLGDLIGCQDAPNFREAYPGYTAGRWRISPRDYARIGLLYMNGGLWKGKQVIPAEWVKAALHSPVSASLPRASRKISSEMLPGQLNYGGFRSQEESMGSYSRLWWINGLGKDGKRLWPDLPADTFAAVGHGGPVLMMVMPSLQLVLSWQESKLPVQALSKGGRDAVQTAASLALRAMRTSA